MAQYIALLSRHVPDWMGNHASVRNLCHAIQSFIVYFVIHLVLTFLFSPTQEDDMQDFVTTGTSGKLHSDEETPTRAESER